MTSARLPGSVVGEGAEDEAGEFLKELLFGTRALPSGGARAYQ